MTYKITSLAAHVRLDPDHAREIIDNAIAANLGCYSWAAKSLGVSYRTLLRYRRKLGVGKVCGNDHTDAT